MTRGSVGPSITEKALSADPESAFAAAERGPVAITRGDNIVAFLMSVEDFDTLQEARKI